MTKRTSVKPIKVSSLQATVDHTGWNSAHVIKRLIMGSNPTFFRNSQQENVKCKIYKFGIQLSNLFLYFDQYICDCICTTFAKFKLTQNCTSYDLD